MTSYHYCNAQKVQVQCIKTGISPSADSDAIAFWQLRFTKEKSEISIIPLL